MKFGTQSRGAERKQKLILKVRSNRKWSASLSQLRRAQLGAAGCGGCRLRTDGLTSSELIEPTRGSLSPGMKMSVNEVYVFRPFKLIALLCVFLALCLDVVALLSPAWVTADHFSLSLWESCSQSEARNPAEDAEWSCFSTLTAGTTFLSLHLRPLVASNFALINLLAWMMSRTDSYAIPQLCNLCWWFYRTMSSVAI